MKITGLAVAGLLSAFVVTSAYAVQAANAMGKKQDQVVEQGEQEARRDETTSPRDSNLMTREELPPDSEAERGMTEEDSTTDEMARKGEESTTDEMARTEEETSPGTKEMTPGASEVTPGPETAAPGQTGSSGPAASSAQGIN